MQKKTAPPKQLKLKELTELQLKKVVGGGPLSGGLKITNF